MKVSWLAWLSLFAWSSILWRQLSIGYYYARESSMAWGVHIKSECSRSTQCVVQMPGFNCSYGEWGYVRHTDAYFDGEGLNCCNHIKWAIKNAVVKWGIIFPDGCCVLNNHNLCNVCHNISISKIDHMSQATKGRWFRFGDNRQVG